jgi:hypothetical protein
MPKRKRPTYELDPDRAIQTKKHDIVEKITQSKKLLHRALKTAKGFERQKLGKRQKIAIDNGKHEDVRRINREIEALKGLDLDKITEAHLQKSLLRVKAISESELLPEEIRQEIEKPRLGEEERKALQNVTSGMFNMKPVKDTMAQVISGMYNVLGIPTPVLGQGKKIQEPLKGILKSKLTEITNEVTNVEDISMGAGNEEELSWDGFDSEGENIEKLSKRNNDNDDGTDLDDEVDIDEETISKYDALLGGSSDEESFDEEVYKAKRALPPSTRLSLSLSPSPSHPLPSDSSIQSKSGSPSPPPQKVTKKPRTNASVEPTKASTFLPSLMGGYWSGSESSASDIEEEVSAPLKKNRKGQMARRAIWEKKFKEGANHIKSGQGPVSQGKDDGWDAKRGAKDGPSRGRGGRGGFGDRGGGGKGDKQRDFSRTTGENSLPVGDRKGGKVAAKRDDAGSLHPSWQAAKKAKTEQKQATFAGKKVVFD